MKIYKTYLLDIYCTSQTQHIHDLFINAKHGWLQFDSSNILTIKLQLILFLLYTNVAKIKFLIRRLSSKPK